MGVGFDDIGFVNLPWLSVLFEIFVVIVFWVVSWLFVGLLVLVFGFVGWYLCWTLAF